MSMQLMENMLEICLSENYNAMELQDWTWRRKEVSPPPIKDPYLDLCM
jgi:hypothetical protein